MPHSKPIIKSVNDVPNVPGLQITVDRNLGAEKLISVKIFYFTNLYSKYVSKGSFDFIESVYIEEAQFGVMKQLGDMLRANSDQLRCNNTASCLELVKQGGFVYIQVIKLYY